MECGHISFRFFLTPFPTVTSVPTSVFPFFPILIVERNVCSPLQQRQAHSSRDETSLRKISRLNKERCGFPRNWAGVRHCVILVAPKRVRKINQSIEVGTNEHIVLTFGLSLVIKLGIWHWRSSLIFPLVFQ